MPKLPGHGVYQPPPPSPEAGIEYSRNVLPPLCLSGMLRADLPLKVRVAGIFGRNSFQGVSYAAFPSSFYSYVEP
jgi:hypothetical protein